MRELLVRNRDFRRLFLASVVSLGGDWFSFVAVASLVTELTGRAGAPAFVYAATVLPVFLASPIAGALADRFDRKRILVIADLVRVSNALARSGRCRPTASSGRRPIRSAAAYCRSTTALRPSRWARRRSPPACSPMPTARRRRPGG